MSWATKTFTAEDVIDARTLGSFIQQELGTPYPSKTLIASFSTVLRTYFDQNPKANWQTLAKVVLWAKAHNKHPARPHNLLDWTRFAWADGWLPELMPSERVSRNLEDDIERVLEKETDDGWRRLLLGSVGVTARREVLAQWQTQH